METTPETKAIGTLSDPVAIYYSLLFAELNSSFYPLNNKRLVVAEVWVAVVELACHILCSEVGRRRRVLSHAETIGCGHGVLKIEKDYKVRMISRIRK